MQKSNLAALTAAAVLLTFSVGSMAETMSKSEYKDSKNTITSEYKAAKEKCASLSGNAKDRCISQAKPNMACKRLA